MRRLITLCLLAVSVVPISIGATQIVNGGFEQPELEGWTVDIGQHWRFDQPAPAAYVAAVGSAEGVPPLHGHLSALIVATSSYGIGRPGDTITCANDMFNLRYCPYPPPGMPGSVEEGGPALSNPLVTPSYYAGSIGQDFVGRTGDVLAWEWQPYGSLWEGGGHPFAQITDGSYVLSLLSYGGVWFYEERVNGQWNSLGGGTVDDGLLWVGRSFSIPSDGLWTAYFGVVQHSDGYWSGGYQLDNVRLQRVPEPPMVVLLLAGLLSLSAARALGLRRRKELKQGG
jgi:hypothetical protein